MSWARRYLLLSIALVALSFAAPARGQDPFGPADPADAPPADAAAPVDPADANPAPAADAAAEPKPAEPQVVTNATVQYLLDSNITAPADKFRAIIVMIDLKHAFAAKPLMQQLVDAKLDVPALAALVARFGTAPFLKLSLATDLQPQGAQFSKAALDASSLATRDPANVKKLVEELKASTPQKQISLTARLREARSAAVPELLAVLADPAQAAAHPQIRRAVLALQEDALPPLWGALQLDGNMRVAAIELLGDLKNKQSVAALLISLYGPDDKHPAAEREVAADAITKLTGYVPSADAATKLLLAKSQSLYENSLKPSPADAPAVEHWTGAGDKLTSKLVAPSLAGLDWAARLAADAAAITPGNPQAEELRLATALALAAAQPAGRAPAESSPANAAALGPDAPGFDAVFLDSLAKGNWLTATEAARLAGDGKGPHTLYDHVPEMSPLVSALRYGDSRLRFAALESILKLQPKRVFPGSTYVSETLANFITGWGIPRAVVVHSDLNKAEELRNLLIGAGYETEVSSDVRTVIDLARASADFELAVIDVTASFPTANDVLAELRRDARTAQVLVAVVAPPERLEEARRIAERYPLAGGFIRPHTPESLQLELDELYALDSRAVTREERLAAGQAAIGMLVGLTVDKNSPIDTTAALFAATEALYRPDVAEKAAEALATWGTADSQSALADAASTPAHPLPLRQVAAQGLRRSIARHGIRLTAAEIQEQYDLYNASEQLDAETQAVLGSILDAIEARSAADEEFNNLPLANPVEPEPENAQ